MQISFPGFLEPVTGSQAQTRLNFREMTLVGLFFLGVLLIFFSDTILNGKVLVPSDILFESPVFASVAPDDFQAPSNPLLFDQAYQFVPWRELEWKAVRQGQIPLWNPYSSSGTPLIATMQSAFFYPPNWIFARILPLEQTFLWSAILKLWLAGVGTYLLLRYYSLSRIAAFIGAVSFMLSSFLIVWLGHPHTNVAVWLPWIILAAEFTIRSEGRRVILGIALMALVTGLMITGGHIETVADILMIVGLYYLFRWLQVIWQKEISLGRKLQKLILPPLAMVILGCALGAIQLLPFLEWLPLSWEYQHRTPGNFQLLNGESIHHLLSLPTLIFPNIYNNPTWAKPYNVFLPLVRGNFNEYIFYTGILTALLALSAVAAGWKRHSIIRVWAIIGFLAFATSMHLPIFDVLNFIPIRNLASPERLRLFILFGLAILAAFGADFLWQAESTRARSTFRILATAGVVIGFAILIGGNTILPALKGQISSYVRGLAEQQYENRLSTATRPLEDYYEYADQTVENLINAFHISNSEMYTSTYIALLGLVLFLYFQKRSGLNTSYFKWGLALLVFLDLFIFGRRLNPSIPADHFNPQPELLVDIDEAKEPFRITALRQSFVPDTQISWGLSDIRGLDFPTTWYNNYLNLVADRIPWLDYGSIFASVDSPLLHVLNVGYLFIDSNSKDTVDPEKWSVVSETPESVLLQSTNLIARGRMLYNVVAAQDDETVLNLLGGNPEMVYDTLILSTSDTMPQADSAGGDWQATLVSQDLNQETWRVATSTDGYFAVSESYYPGWEVTLDGETTPLYRANMAFRAVFVPSGNHEIRFTYKPFWLPVGAVMSGIALIVIMGMLGFALIRPQNRLRSRQQAE